MSNSGWIALHRKLLDNPIILQDSDYLAVWIWLLLNAVHNEHDAMFRGQRITLMPGQLIASKEDIARSLKIDSTKAHRILCKLQSALQIEIQTSTKNRLITITNWDKYQHCEPQNEPQNAPQVNCNCTASEPLLNNNETNSLLRILKNKIYTAGVPARGMHSGLIDEVIETLIKGTKLENARMFGGAAYTANDFVRIAQDMDAYKMSRIVNRLLQKKDTIENREYYILGLLAEM